MGRESNLAIGWVLIRMAAPLVGWHDTVGQCSDNYNNAEY